MSPSGRCCRPELFFALVGALGSDLDIVASTLESELSDVKYRVSHLRVSDILHQITRWKNLPTFPLDVHIDRHQIAGNLLRKMTKCNEAMAVLGAGKIRSLREKVTGNQKKSADEMAYVIRSLKHPDEVRALRRIYGPNFFLLAAYSPHTSRLGALSRAIALSHQSTRADLFKDVAQRLIQRDEAEAGKSFGQHVGDTFPLADAFFNADKPELLKSEVARFVEILFGFPYHTPTRDEFGMFHAQAAALRSADVSRQVGAAIATDDGDVIAIGTNEVPKPGGGLYWPGDKGDARDFQMPRIESQEMRRATLGEILSRLMDASLLKIPRRAAKAGMGHLIDRVVPLMKGTQLMGIGEFGRVVHAEMAALLDAARRGVSVRDLSLFTTTFPCHTCTRHIIAAGIRRVIYVEPYPKSHAEVLHRDAIVVDSPAVMEGKVNFEPFVGIAPRQYMRMFSLANRECEGTRLRRWNRVGAMPRFLEQWFNPAYPSLEEKELYGLNSRMRRAGLSFLKS